MADGKLQGTVIVMGNNRPIEGANVQVEGGPSATSDRDGNWGPIALPGGESYNVEVAASGFRDGLYEGIFVLENDTTQVIFGLAQAFE